MFAVKTEHFWRHVTGLFLRKIPFFCMKNSASECNESLLSDCRAQPVLLEKTVPASAMKACFQIAERSLFYWKKQCQRVQ